MTWTACPSCSRRLSPTETRCPDCGHIRSVTPTWSDAWAEESLAADLVPPPPTPDRPMVISPTLSPEAAEALDARALTGVAPPGYEIVGELGRGGMGVVYKAKQLRAGRLVALKMILAGAHAADDERQRFRTEAEAIARLSHSGIVTIYEVGEHDGLPYFSLELCEGGSLEKKLAGTPLPPAEAAALLEKLADAMQAAHRARVLHRDLKPANVLLSGGERGALAPRGEAHRVEAPPSGGSHPPLAHVVPKITDFGLARKLDTEGHTAPGVVMGTPSYMPPEQARGWSMTLGPTCDVYSLGAILYECLTGRPPFRAATPLDTVLQVLRDEPVAPSGLNAQVPRDLETICLKCLEKEPERRYGSAQALADDLRRFLDGRPVLARPAGSAERLLKWARRNPAVAALSGAVAVALLAGATVATGFGLHAKEQARLAGEAAAEAGRKEKEVRVLAGKERKARELAEENEQAATDAARRAATALNAMRLQEVVRAWRQNDLRQAEAVLDEVPATFRDGWEYRHVAELIRRKVMTLRGHTAAVLCLCFSADGRRLFTGSADWTVKVWDTVTGRELHTLKGHWGNVICVACSPDGQRVVSVGPDKTPRMWDTETGKELFRLDGHTFPVIWASYSPDGERVVTASLDRTIRIWDAHTGRVQWIISGLARPVACIRHSPDGRHLISVSQDLFTRFHDARTGVYLGSYYDRLGTARRVVWSPDGRRFLRDGLAAFKVRDVRTNQELVTLEGVALASAGGFCYRPNGEQIATVTLDAQAWVLDAHTGQKAFALRGHTSTVLDVAYSPDARRLATASPDSTVKIWDAQRTQELLIVRGHRSPVRGVSHSPDGRYLASASRDRTVRVWDAHTGRMLRTLEGHGGWVRDVAYSPDGTRIVSGGDDATLRIWDAESGKELRTLAGHSGAVCSVSFSPDGKQVLSASEDNTMKVWDAQTGEVARTLRGHDGAVWCARYDVDGRHIVSGSQDRTAKVWDAQTGEVLLSLEGHTSSIWGVAFSPDGESVVTGAGDKLLKLWDARTGRHQRTLAGHTSDINRVVFTPDGKRLVSCGDDHTIKLWDPVTGHAVLTLLGHAGSVHGISCSRDGTQIVSAGFDSTLRVWDVYAGPERDRERIAREDREYHQEEFVAAEKAGRPFAAVFHLDQLLRLEPAERDELWGRRRAILAAALKRDPSDEWAALALARQEMAAWPPAAQAASLVGFGAGRFPGLGALTDYLRER